MYRCYQCEQKSHILAMDFYLKLIVLFLLIFVSFVHFQFSASATETIIQWPSFSSIQETPQGFWYPPLFRSFSARVHIHLHKSILYKFSDTETLLQRQRGG